MHSWWSTLAAALKLKKLSAQKWSQPITAVTFEITKCLRLICNECLLTNFFHVSAVISCYYFLGGWSKKQPSQPLQLLTVNIMSQSNPEYNQKSEVKANSSNLFTIYVSVVRAQSWRVISSSFLRTSLLTTLTAFMAAVITALSVFVQGQNSDLCLLH